MEFIKQTKITLDNGSVFEGSVNIKLEKGKITYLNGESYEGSFLGSKKHGSGIMMTKNGNIHDGIWKNDKFMGKGKITFLNGDVIIFGDTLDSAKNIIITKKNKIKKIQITINNKIIEEINLPECMHDIENIDHLKNILKNNIKIDTQNLSENEIEKISCPISLNTIADPIMTSCNHTFDKKQLEKHMSKQNNNCPLCREPIYYILPNEEILELLLKVKYFFIDKEISYFDSLNIETIRFCLEEHEKEIEVKNYSRTTYSGYSGGFSGGSMPSYIPN
jgi:hypothetical protein